MSKIIVNQVELKNFFSYGNQWQTVDFQEGVSIVLGHDKDKDRSNGAGKTSFLEAIPFALFGQTSKGVAQNKIINWKNGKQCEVKLHFVKDGIPYILHRGIKPGILELIKDGVPVPKLSDKRIFQQELETDLIGMDFKAAQALLFQNANNMVSIFNTPRADKRRFIEKFFNLEIYSTMNERVNGKLGNVVKRISELEMEVGFKRRRIDELTRIIESVVIPDLSVYKDNVERSSKTLSDFVVRYYHDLTTGPDIEGVVAGHKSDKQSLVSEINEGLKSIGKIKDSISKLQGERTFLEKRIVDIGDLTEQKEKVAKIVAVLGKMEGLENQSKEKNTIIKGLQESKSEILGRFTSITTKKAQSQRELDKWYGYETTGESTCPTCFQQVDPQHIHDHVQSLIDECSLEIQGYMELLELITQEVIDNKQRIDDEIQLLTDLDVKIDKKRQLEKHLAALSGVEGKVKELDETNQRINEINGTLLISLENDKVVVESDVDSLSKQRDEIDATISQLQVNLNEYKDLAVKKSRLESESISDEKILVSQTEIYDRVMAEHLVSVASKAQLEEEVSVFDVESKKLQKMKDHLDYVKETLKDENVKQFAISNIVPFLQQQTNHYLAETNNYYVTLDSWLDGTIHGYGVGECEFGNMSGGEGKSIDLALKFAMMDVARRQAGSYLDVLVLDELLDSSIDSHGMERMMSIVRAKQREDNLKVFVVSHREEVASFDVDHTYLAEKVDGLSTIRKV